MNKLLLIFLLTYSSYCIACSCAPYYSFCETKSSNWHDVLLYGNVVDTSALNLRLDIIQVVEGVETRDTIIIWNDTANICESMKASELANPGDTILILLNRINQIKNSWDVIGDYKTPSTYCAQVVMLIKNSRTFGLVNQTIDQSVIPPIYTFYSDYNIFDVIGYMNSNGGSCLSIRNNTFDYTPFPTNNVRWTGSNYRMHGSTGVCYEEEFTYTHDTTVNGKVYHILSNNIVYGASSSAGWCVPTGIRSRMKRYYRNDVVNRRVYFLNQNFQDSLAYDFNLTIGDTIPNRGNPSLSGITVKSIDFIQINNKQHRRFELESGVYQLPFYLIEGVGYSVGLGYDIYDLNGLCCWGTLDCFSENNFQYIPTNGTGRCSILTSLKADVEKEEEVYLFPNPTNSVVNINASLNIQKLVVYDSKGVLIKEESEEVKRIVLPEDNGIYFIQLMTEQGKTFSQKILKH